ncbi:MAG: DUF4870 domain-containing protein [Saprospiraceae bacterium]
MENPGNQTPTTGTDPKVVAIVAYITLIGWIVALVLNNPKSEFGSFHIRQALGIFLVGIVLSLIPVINLVAWIFAFVLWILGLISAVQGQQKTVPVVGEYFQRWFNAL